jgi:hypothetical protein
MEGTEKPHVDKYKEITNNWNYDASCTLTSLPVWDLEIKRLIFIVQSVQSRPCHVKKLNLHVPDALLLEGESAAAVGWGRHGAVRPVTAC